jgi:hypothetical protein
MIYPTVIAVMFVLIVNVMGIENMGTPVWWEGFIVGILTVLVWHTKEKVSRFLGLFGVIFLVFVAFGLGSNLSEEGKSFFNGMSLGMLPGFFISAWWRWDRFKPVLLTIAKMEDHKWLLRLLGEK